MATDPTPIGILVRREIEARIAGPIIRAFSEKMGIEEALAVVRPVIEELAKDSGQAAAGMAGGNSIDHFVKAMEAWATGDAYDMEILEKTEQKYNWNITRCAYAEMYKDLGMEDLGYVFSCGRDFAMVTGFNPRMTLKRTKTLMQGDAHCDFRLSLTY